MATIRPRLQVTLPPEVKETYDSTAKVMGIPTSQLVAQILSEAVDSIEAMGIALSAVKNGDSEGIQKLIDFSKDAGKTFDEDKFELDFMLETNKRSAGKK